MNALELIFVAALAGVLLYLLYGVLGRQVGRGPESLPQTQSIGGVTDLTKTPAAPLEESGPLTGLAAMKARDPGFDISQFLNGARSAYQMIVKAFADGDRAALKPLLSDNVMGPFEAAMAEREAQGRSESVDFLAPPRADFEGVDVVGDVAKAAVRFLAEYRKRSKGPEGEAVDDLRTAEIWTFERNLKSRDPNWLLIHVDAAEA